jgi:hypothetical protein
MMSNALKIAPPPPRPKPPEAEPATTPKPEPAKFAQVKEDQRVQFNKRVTQRVADGYEMLAIRTHKKVPDLLAEGLDFLEKRYGKV